MLDYYSDFPAPSEVIRKEDVRKVTIKEYGHLSKYETFIDKAVSEIEPGSWTLYSTVTKNDIYKRVVQLCEASKYESEPQQGSKYEINYKSEKKIQKS